MHGRQYRGSRTEISLSALLKGVLTLMMTRFLLMKRVCDRDHLVNWRSPIHLLRMRSSKDTTTLTTFSQMMKMMIIRKGGNQAIDYLLPKTTRSRTDRLLDNFRTSLRVESLHHHHRRRDLRPRLQRRDEI